MTLPDLSSRLIEWLPQQRWFGSKGRPVSGAEVVQTVRLVGGEVSCDHVLVDVGFADGAEPAVERYQLLVGLRADVPERLEHAVIGVVGADPAGAVLADGRFAYDAVHDSELTNVLLQLLAEAASEGPLKFGRLPGEVVPTDLTSIVMGAEQSNTSLVYGDALILKLFRRLAPGINPDLEITRALAQAGCTAAIPPLAWMETAWAPGRWPISPDTAEPATLGLLQPYLKSGTEGWKLAVTSVRDLFAEGDLHADEVGGDFAGESERLGAATAEVHTLLARLLPARPATAEENVQTAARMNQRLDAAVRVVPALAEHAAALRDAYDALAALPPGVPIQRIHGDLHLGQVLRTDTGWVLLDFEGEPARPLRERRELMSPLRDVAGMLRSYDYAARHLLAEQPGAAHLEYRATEWAERNRNAFCNGYTAGGGQDPRESAVLLRAFELDKAVYEVVYEARHRPAWLDVPLGSIARLAETG